jgi:tripartite-type tricarboxylate transporter receptor subunit TctC
MSNQTGGRREFLKRAGAVGGAALLTSTAGCTGLTGGGGGSDYPSQEVRQVVPYATGGGFDAYARLSEPYWEEYLGTDMTVENITGGGGVSGGTEVYNAEPNGYTQLIWAPGEALPSQIGQDVGYDIREMSHIGFMTQTPSALIITEDTGIETWSDFANNVGDLNFATQGVGTMAHVGMEMLAELTGDFSRDSVNYVHYGGTGEVLGGLEKGEANAFLITAGDSGAKVVQGIEGTRLFLVFSQPDTINWYFDDAGVNVEHYIPDVDADGLDQMATISSMRRFFAGPPDVPEEVLSTQRDAFQEIINDEEFTDEALEAQRPVIEPGDHTVVEDVIQESYDLMTSDPYQGIIEGMF